MKLKKNDGTYLEVSPKIVNPEIYINYDLLLKSDGNFRSVDRGIYTDRYASNMTFFYEETKLDELYNELFLLRDNNKEVELSELELPYFGENLSDAQIYKCVIYNIGKIVTEDLGVKSFEVNFLPTQPVALTSTTYPTDLQCLSLDYDIYQSWKSTVNETYSRNNYYANRVADVYSFRGSYVMNHDSLAELLGFWAYQRGNSFTINESDFGVSGMFGPTISTTQHKVIIDKISYNFIGQLYRDVTITLWRVNE